MVVFLTVFLSFTTVYGRNSGVMYTTVYDVVFLHLGDFGIIGLCVIVVYIYFSVFCFISKGNINTNNFLSLRIHSKKNVSQRTQSHLEILPKTQRGLENGFRSLKTFSKLPSRFPKIRKPLGFRKYRTGHCKSILGYPYGTFEN